MDQSTIDLMVQLQLEDAGLHFETPKGKSREPTDEELAVQLQEEELKCASQILADRRMASSFAAAVRADGRLLEIHQGSLDLLDRPPRQVTGTGWVIPDDFEREVTDLDDETLVKLQMLSGDVVMGTADSETDQAESSAWAAQRNSQPLRDHVCVACTEPMEFINVARAPCQHEYCRSCLEDLFRAVMRDESLFPPRCCQQPINLNMARIFLSTDLVKQYMIKKVEYETPNRTYCYLTSCSAFIGAAHITGVVATCPECECTTCVSCKERAHTGDCPVDPSMQKLLATARKNRWQRCYRCSRIVALAHGCNHITCLCGGQFCYDCGVKWKECNCEHWTAVNLLERAHEIIDRDGSPDIDDGRLPQENLQRAIQGLRENNDCRHGGWNYLPGPRQCERCAQFLARFIFECRRCRLQVCNRCRRNRL
ncbi:hypothetical protein BO71DRAFT_354762 [Aspergillus ellipticus CBS 707.79]|uniref:RBR-type E3 ubiquitin transferase n=1 Tax=Aspergillus ellipticus CBS 707.79 TaxID=1448320 RepID=A0A319DZN3_9EURO|nr:hypothetical protein BO71DRAFT_354762 [Aspergillus ellipticus CBS 707.79]